MSHNPMGPLSQPVTRIALLFWFRNETALFLRAQEENAFRFHLTSQLAVSRQSCIFRSVSIVVGTDMVSFTISAFVQHVAVTKQPVKHYEICCSKSDGKH
jgi:hypothetical protein